MGWFTLGDAEGTTSDLKIHPAVLNYQECREARPVDMTRGALSPADPCWTQLVALRRYQGRDPLGRDVYGPGGYQDLAIKTPAWAEIERTGRAAIPNTQFETPRQLVIVVEQRKERVRKKAAETEALRAAVEKRQSDRAKEKDPVIEDTSAKSWQIAGAALGIGLALGKLFGGGSK